MSLNITKPNNNHNMKLSIIVPVYNVQDYIWKCANSLLCQTSSMDDYEVLFIIDGSTDKSEKVLNDFIKQKSFKNARIFQKENGGLSSARNYGIKRCTGDYIWFVDSDDWIENNSVEILLSNMHSNAEIILMTQYYHNTNTQQTLACTKSSQKLCTGADLFKEHPPICSVCYICKRSFLNSHKFSFVEGIFHEDAEFTPRVLYTASIVQTIQNPLYHHYKREGSITQTPSPKRIYDLMIVLKNNIKFYSEKVKVQDRKWYAHVCSTCIYSILEISRSMNNTIKSDINTFFNNNPILIKILKQNNLQSYIFALLIQILPLKPTAIYLFLWKLKGR